MPALSTKTVMLQNARSSGQYLDAVDQDIRRVLCVTEYRGAAEMGYNEEYSRGVRMTESMLQVRFLRMGSLVWKWFMERDCQTNNDSVY